MEIKGNPILRRPKPIETQPNDSNLIGGVNDKKLNAQYKKSQLWKVSEKTIWRLKNGRRVLLHNKCLGKKKESPPSETSHLSKVGKKATMEAIVILSASAKCKLPSMPLGNHILRELNNKVLRETLDLLPIVRGDAHLKEEIAKIRTGDLVLRNMEAIGKRETQGKNTSNWEGQYMIIEEVRLGTFRLTIVKGNEVLRIWHSNNYRRHMI
ncbi:hypothetical protein Cgig2_009176 [Carnegiea gigantea]|uniref:Uncharacterized protein n=1 Tax=Carnegiea gigantea TaxID=171969 RepID=A0A9Q1QGX0_9CARY|nr:hypothetical protein Cgig2_009176 [Carnegiea gigantea]